MSTPIKIVDFYDSHGKGPWSFLRHIPKADTPRAFPSSSKRLSPLFRRDQESFSEGHVKTNSLCNLGYGDPSALHPRLPRLTFAEACSLL
jgi:hypothetical protein